MIQHNCQILDKSAERTAFLSRPFAEALQIKLLSVILSIIRKVISRSDRPRERNVNVMQKLEKQFHIHCVPGDGMLTVAGGIVITFTKEILTLITG